MTMLYAAVLLVLALAVTAYALDRFVPRLAARIGLTIERQLARLAWDCASIPGAQMPYLEGGRGETIVLLHGFGADKENFVRLARHLTRHYHVVIPDLPGFGEASRDPDADYSIAAQASNLHAFLYKLGLDQVHLGGNSMGGFIATEFAARYPERVASLWLLSAAGTAAGQNSALDREYTSTGMLPWLVPDLAAFDRLLDATTARPLFLPWSTRRRLALRGTADFALHTRVMRQLRDSPFLEARYFRIAAPALIVWGGADQIHHGAGADALQAIMPNSQVVRMPGVGHLPMIEAPRRCATDYLAFLAALPRVRHD